MPKCSCKKHEEFARECEFRVSRISSNKFQVKTIQCLIDNGFLTRRCVYICSACAAYAEKHLIPNTDEQQDEVVNQIIDKIKTNDISDNDVNRIVAAIVERERSKIKSDINSVSSQYSDVEFLKTCEQT
jgi:transcriptional regulator CtsR